MIALDGMLTSDASVLVEVFLDYVIRPNFIELAGQPDA